MSLHFAKLHGLGNDFVVVDRRGSGPVDTALGIALCDRHRGIGADGVLSVGRSAHAPIAMHVTNPDGSIAEMCGNGLRCVVRWAVDRGLLPPTGGDVETGRGVLRCAVEPDGEVTVDMGAPRLRPREIPVDADGERFVSRPVTVGDRSLLLTAVSMGNPHAVAFVDEAPRPLAERLGPMLERHPLFPNRVNAGFARVRADGSIELVVWERGAGLTQACGTGACAAVVAGVVTGRVPAGVPVPVDLPGGRLRIRVEPDLRQVHMTGPAVELFSGDWTAS